MYLREERHNLVPPGRRGVAKYVEQEVLHLKVISCAESTLGEHDCSRRRRQTGHVSAGFLDRQADTHFVVNEELAKQAEVLAIKLQTCQ